MSDERQAAKRQAKDGKNAGTRYRPLEVRHAARAQPVGPSKSTLF